MSRSRGQSGNSISLFPFLAVLMCAMGLLIFLLLVTTQQIRTDTIALHIARRKSEKPQTPTVVKPSLPLAIAPQVVEPPSLNSEPVFPWEPEIIEPIPGLVELGNGQTYPVFPPAKVAPPEPDPEPLWPAAMAQKPNPTDPNIKLRVKASELEAAKKAWLDAVQKKQQTVAKLQAEVDLLTESLKKINSQIEAVAKERSGNSETEQQLLKTQNQMLGQLAKVEQQIDDARKLANGSATKFQVVPFDGQTGTNYRPIIIECTAAGMRFVPEDVLLTQEDFDSFTLGKNPLLAGARALSDYWTKVSIRSRGTEPEPYVLLIVRPSGAKYFAARQLLEALDRPFGYELVEENLPIQVPPVDPVAAELCKSAVEATLREREDLKRLLAEHGPEILSRNPNYRVIRKPEGGFDVEYSPDGKFPDQGVEGNSGQPQDGNNPGPFGSPSSSGSGDAKSHGVFGESNPARDPRLPLISQAPHYTGDVPQEPAGPLQPFSDEPGFVQTPQGPERLGAGSDPKQPRLLPEDIIRRSQGQVPYTDGRQSFMPPAPSEAAGNRDAAPSSIVNGNSQEPAAHSGNTIANSSTQPNVSGNSQPVQGETSSGNTQNAPNPNVNVDANGQRGQSSVPSNPTSPPPAPTITDLGTPASKPQTLPFLEPLVGAPGNAAGGLPVKDAPMSAYEAGMPNFYTLNERRSLNPADPYQRRWGLSDPRASIGFEREITVRIEPNRLVIGNRFAVAYNDLTTRQQLGAVMLEAIELTVRKWGRPPMSFYWVPTVEFQATEADAATYHALNRIARSWGLETTVKEIGK